MKNPWTIIGIIAVVLFGGAFWYASISAEKSNEGVEIQTHIKGNPDAAVRLVEYSDFQCPACAAFQPAINEAVSQFGDNLALEYKHFPLPIHPYATQAAVAAEAAGQQDKFFEYHDLLFQNQPAWSQSATPKALFLQYADDLDLDMDAFRRHMNSSVLRDHVLAQFAEGRSQQITGTPTFFLNGKRMQPETYEAFLTQIADAIGTPESDEEASPVPSGEPEVLFGI